LSGVKVGKEGSGEKRKEQFNLLNTRGGRLCPSAVSQSLERRHRGQEQNGARSWVRGQITINYRCVEGKGEVEEEFI